MVENRFYTPAGFTNNRWFRLGFSITLAFALALILLLLPVTKNNGAQLPPSPSTHHLDLALPLGAEIVYATGGLTITKTASPTPTVNQGDLLTYTLVVRNDTNFDLTNVTVTDTVPANATCFTLDTPPGWLSNGAGNCQTGGEAVWVLPSPSGSVGGVITRGTAVTLTYSVVVAQPLPDLSEITNAALSYGVEAISPTTFIDSGAQTITTTVFAPAWQISKVADPTPLVQPGDFLTYTLTITNSGHLTTTGDYTISDELPNNTDFVSASSPGTFGAGNVTWVLSTPIGINDSFTVSYTVVVTDNLAEGTEIANQTYSIAGGNVFSPAFGPPVTVTVQTPVTLTLTKLDDPNPVPAGGLLNYTLIVTNDASSKGPASNVVVTDTIPANTSLVDAGFVSPAGGITTSLGSVVTWTLTNPDPLGIGDQATLTMTVRVASPLTDSTIITNDVYGVSVSNDAFNLMGVNPVTTEVESAPALTITKVGLPEPVSAGEQLTYTIRYTNTGNANATNVLISDTFPASTTFQSEDSSPVVHPGAPIANGRQWNVGFLAGEGGSGVITLTLDVLAPQDPGTSLTDVVAITSSEIITPVLFTATNTISSSPQLHITKTADPSPVAIGSILTYTITFSNSGNADATNATLTDTLDSNVAFNGASGGGVHNNGVVTWTGLSIPADGLDRTLEVSVTVAATLPNNSLLTNNVEVVAGSVRATGTLTTLVQAPALTITKIVSPTGVVRAGDAIEYTIIYTNTGPITVTTPGVLITDTFPVSITNVVSSTSSNDSTPPTPEPTPFVWADTEVPANGGFGVITITGQVITSPWASSGGQIVNDVIVAGSGYSATTTATNQGRPGLPAVITITATPPSTPVNNTILVGVQAEDIYGNPIFDNTPITLTTTLAGSTLDGSPSSTVVNTSGGSATANLFSTVAGTTTLTAQVDGASGTLTDTTVATFTPGAVIGFVLQATSPQTAGVSFPITIRAVDAFSNTVTSVNQSITVNDTTGTIAPTAVTLVNGITTTNFTVIQATSPALDRITAISGSITGTVDVEIRPNTPATLTVTVNPTTINVCQTADVTATITDNFNNPISGQTIDLGTLPAGFATFSPVSGNTNSAGVFNSTLTGINSGNPTIGAQSGSLFGSSSITINAPAIPTNLTLTVSPNSLATGGNTALVTATVTDCLGLSADQVVTFTVSNPTLATLSPSSDTTNASGVATTTLTSNSIPQDGVVVVTATVGSLVQTATVTLFTPVLTITKTANPTSGTEVRPGQAINYTLQVINTGSGPASNVVITDVLPAEVGFVSFVSCPGGATCSGGSTTTVTTPTLGAGQTMAATLQVTVTAPTSGTVISNNATAQSSQTSLITSNIVVHTVTTATVDLFLPIIFKDFAPAADLRITSFTVTGTDPNRVVTIVVENAGNTSTGEGFWVDFYVNPTTLPDNPALGSNRRWELLGSTQGIAWPVPALAAGESVTLTSNGAPGTLAPAPSPLSNWSGTLPGGANNLYAFVDSFAEEGDPFVEIAESNEANNLASLVITAATGLAVAPSSAPDLDNLPPRWQP